MIFSVSSSPSAYKRSAKNYLLDPKFQFKYTGLLVLVALLISAILGPALWWSSRQIIEQGTETVRRGKITVEESKKVSDVVSMNIKQCYGDDPNLQELFQEEADKRKGSLEVEQGRLEQDASRLQNQARRFPLMLLAGLSILVLAVGLAGIIFTHKIAGPVFKMMGLLRRVGEGELQVGPGLRKGDELVAFFEAFRKMVEQLRERQQSDVDALAAAIQRLAPDVSDEKLGELRALEESMKRRLGD